MTFGQNLSAWCDVFMIRDVICLSVCEYLMADPKFNPTSLLLWSGLWSRGVFFLELHHKRALENSNSEGSPNAALKNLNDRETRLQVRLLKFQIWILASECDFEECNFQSLVVDLLLRIINLSSLPPSLSKIEGEMTSAYLKKLWLPL